MSVHLRARCCCAPICSFDEYIKSYLMKERRFFRRERKALDNRYPYAHAIELTRDIRKLGTVEGKVRPSLCVPVPACMHLFARNERQARIQLIFRSLADTRSSAKHSAALTRGASSV